MSDTALLTACRRLSEKRRSGLGLEDHQQQLLSTFNGLIQQPSELSGLAALPAVEEHSFDGLWPHLLGQVSSSLVRHFGLTDAKLEALRFNQEDSLSCCVLQCGDEGCNIVYVSRGFEQATGYDADISMGETLELLEIQAPGLNQVVNEQELVRVQEFCQLGHDAQPGASIVALLLHEREAGDRFWDLVRMQHVALEGKRYIFSVHLALPIALPTLIREARFVDGVRVDEAQISCFLDTLAAFLERLRPTVHGQADAGQQRVNMEELQDMITRSILAFMKTNTSDFEGDHWVPLLGQNKALEFQQDVKWSGILGRVQNSLYKIWEVSERHDEVVACAVSDPTGDDCPLVYISREFEKLTGYQRDWVLGRNCRFLQPNHCWRNAAFNKEECLRMRAFCKEPQPEHTRIINLLVNERKDGYPFWNLLVMEHIQVEVQTSGGCVDRRYYIFGVQTNLEFQMPRLTELLAMDTRGLAELRRLRDVFRSNEGFLKKQTLNTFASECISLWASKFPANLELPRFQICAARSKAKVAVPVVGIEVNAHNILEIMHPAMEDGIRHFYLTFTPPPNGQVFDARMSAMDAKLLSLRLAAVLSGLGKSFLHYLRENVTFSFVTPPQMVKSLGEITKPIRSHGYAIGFWLLDLRFPDRMRSGTSIAGESWRFMSEAWRDGEVQALGLCGAGREMHEFVQRVPDAAPISAFGLELFPGKSVSKYRYLHNPQGNGGMALIAFNVLGPKQSLLETQGVQEEAYRLETDEAMLLMKWCSSKVDGLMVPATVLDAGRRQRRALATAASELGPSPALFESSQIRQSAGGASMAPGEPSNGESSVHRSFVKLFHRAPVVEHLPQLVAACLDPGLVDVEGSARRRLSATVDLSGRGPFASRAASKESARQVGSLPPVGTPRRFSAGTASLRGTVVLRSYTHDGSSQQLEVPSRQGSKRGSHAGSSTRASTISEMPQPPSRSLLATVSPAALLAEPTGVRLAPPGGEARNPSGQTPKQQLKTQHAKLLDVLGPSQQGLGELAAGGGDLRHAAPIPTPPSHQLPLDSFRRAHHKQRGHQQQAESRTSTSGSIQLL